MSAPASRCSPIPARAGAPAAHSGGPAVRAALPDHASHADDRGVAIDRVGIARLRWPITVWDRSERFQPTVATIEASVGLPADVRGTHMSRFVEVLQGVRGELSLTTLPELCAAIQRRLDADSAQIDVRFPYFMTKHAPVSGAASLMEYEAAFHAARDGEDFRFELEVVVPVTTLCPCSKAVSDRGAHNQRGRVTVRVKPREFLWIEDVVEAVEACASAPLFALLKREDEKWVTEHAYDHPVFVEDLIRDVTRALQPRASWLSVEVENLESIHAHSAWARLEWSADAEAAPDAGDAAGVADAGPGPHDEAELPGPFGAWLRAQRVARSIPQQELAARLGVSAPQLSRVEAGERHLPDGAYEALSGLLGRSPDWLRLRAGIIPERLVARIQADPAAALAALGG